MDPRYRGINLSKDEVDAGLELCSRDYMYIMFGYCDQLQADAGPFKPFMFTEEVLQTISPLTWWESQKSVLQSNVMVLCRKILGAVASSAGVERIFSTFGFVHSKVRNRLGTAKAGKLVFLYKMLNTHK